MKKPKTTAIKAIILSQQYPSIEKQNERKSYRFNETT